MGWKAQKKQVSSGVIQGSAAGPALFSFFSNDIPECVGENVHTSLFADDIKLYALDKLETEDGAQRVVDWSAENSLPLAPDKSVFIKIRRRRSEATTDTIQIGGATIQSTSSVRDLGVLLSDDLECSKHVLEITRKAFRTCNLIIKVLKTKKIEIFKKAFYALVLPGLEYCSVVWCPIYRKDIIALETVQRRFTKRAQRKCGLKNEEYDDRLKRWKIPTLETRRLHIDLIMVYKILYGFVDIERNDFFRVTVGEVLNIYPTTLPSNMRNNTQMNTLAGRTYQTWNRLPPQVKNAHTVFSFKQKLKKFLLV
jgi:hypothetical protein